MAFFKKNKPTDTEKSAVKANTLNSALLNAVNSDAGLNYIQNLIEKGADINIRNSIGESLLDITHDEKIISFLLEKGLGFTSQEALNKAAYFCVYSPATLQRLIEVGSDINYTAPNWAPPIFWATAVTNIDSLTVLLDNHADINAQYYLDKNTPLHLVVKNKNLAGFQMLLARGAATDIKNLGGETVVELARRMYQETKDIFYRSVLVGFDERIPVPPAKIITDTDKISFIREEWDLGLRITEIFNFKSGIYREVIYCKETNTQSSSVLGFDALESTKHLAAAEAEFIRQGGVPEYSLKTRLDKR